MSVGSNTTRRVVRARYGFSCAFCGSSTAKLTMHHIRPRSVGGSDSLRNLVPLCSGCHIRMNSLVASISNYIVWFYSFWFFALRRRRVVQSRPAEAEHSGGG